MNGSQIERIIQRFGNVMLLTSPDQASHEFDASRHDVTYDGNNIVFRPIQSGGSYSINPNRIQRARVKHPIGRDVNSRNGNKTRRSGTGSTVRAIEPYRDSPSRQGDYPAGFGDFRREQHNRPETRKRRGSRYADEYKASTYGERRII